MGGGSNATQETALAAPRRNAALSAALLVALLAAAGAAQAQQAPQPHTPPHTPLHTLLHTGDTLLDHPEALRVEAHPATNLPAELAAQVAEAVRAGGWTLGPDAWRRVSSRKLAPDLMPLLMHVSDAFWGGLGEGTHVWAAPLPASDVLALGRVWITHEGRPTSYLRDQAASFEGAPGRAPWVDGEGATVFVWDDIEQRLLALRSTPPGPITYGLQRDERSLLARLEARLLSGSAAPTDARALASALELAGERRPALLAPAGTRLALAVDGLGGDALELVYGVADLADTSDAQRPGSAGGRSDGMTFALDFEDEGGARTLWSGEAGVAEGWATARVDITSLRGRRGVLRLSTGPGAAGDATYDHGAWASLRLLADDPPPPDRPHVVLIDVDTLRADRLGCYGHARPTSPRIDAWAAAQAEVFRDSTAVGDWTLPTTLSMLTGLATSQHGVTDVTRGLAPGLPTLAELLRAAGYETWARTDGGYVVPSFGFARGFDRFRVRRRPWHEHQRLGWSEELAWLAERRSGRPVFLFLQTYQVHTPYPSDRRFDDPASPYDGPFAVEDIDRLLLQRAVAEGRPPSAADRAWVSAQYDAAVRRMDDVVGAFLEALPAAFGDEPYLVVFTSDHGEELFDRGWFGHRHSLHGELLNVPLIVRHPDTGRVGVVDRPVSTLDVVPTILDHAGLERPENLPGRSLRLAPPPDELRVAFHEDDAWAVLLDGLKLIVAEGRGAPAVPGEPLHSALYDLGDDPLERHDLTAERHEQATRLRELLARWLQRHAAAADGAAAPVMDAQLLHDLDALGYTGR